MPFVEVPLGKALIVPIHHVAARFEEPLVVHAGELKVLSELLVCYGSEVDAFDVDHDQIRVNAIQRPASARRDGHLLDLVS